MLLVCLDTVHPSLRWSSPWAFAMYISVEKDVGVSFWIHSADMTKVSQSFCGNPVDDGFFHVLLCSYLCVSHPVESGHTNDSPEACHLKSVKSVLIDLL